MSFSRGIVVFSGGSAANNLVDAFNAVKESKQCPLSYIIPISDNGGSSSELIRPASTERTAIANLFNHRLSSTSSPAAAEEWQSIVAGISLLWSSIPSSKKQLIRSFFNLINLEILKRSRPPTSTFDFTSASVGNLFLTGARLFSGSFESAIYLLGSITGVPDDVHVIPAINSNFTHHIAAGLADGSIIVGQNSISHPSEPTALETGSSPLPRGSKAPPSQQSLGNPKAVEGIPSNDHKGLAPASGWLHRVDSDHTTDHLTSEEAAAEAAEAAAEEEEDGNLPGALPTLRFSTIKFTKTPTTNDDLASRISRIWYINPYGQEISPPANPRVCESVNAAQAIIYSIGSLYTSIIPSIIPRGVGEAIRRSAGSARQKILILNGSLDREVGPSGNPFTAVDFVEAIVQAGEESRGMPWTKSAAIVTRTSSLPDNVALGTTATEAAPPPPPPPLSMNQPSIHSNYITHLIHLAGPGTPHVDRTTLRALGIDTLKLYGRKIEVPGPEGNLVARGLRYDPTALVGAIETILGRKGAAIVDDDEDDDGLGATREGGGERKGDRSVKQGKGKEGMGRKSRRNTLEARA